MKTRKAFPTVDLTGDPEKDEVSLGLLEDFILDKNEPLGARLKALKQYMTEGLGAKNYSPTEEDLKAFAEDNLEFMSKVAKIASAVNEKPKVASSVDEFKQYVENHIKSCLDEIAEYASSFEFEDLDAPSLNPNAFVSELENQIDIALANTFENFDLGGSVRNAAAKSKEPEVCKCGDPKCKDPKCDAACKGKQGKLKVAEKDALKVAESNDFFVLEEFPPELRPKVEYLVSCSQKIQDYIKAGDFGLARMESDTLAHHLTTVNNLMNKSADNMT